MPNSNQIKFDSHVFSIENASFRFITDSISGPGWDFNFSGPCASADADESEYPYGIRLMTEAAPLPLKKSDDLTGETVELNSPFDEETGEPYFDLNVMESHDVLNLRLTFLKKRQQDYLIEIEATVDETVTGRPEKLSLLAWTKQEPEHAYPA